jgi:hypothetical protein
MCFTREYQVNFGVITITLYKLSLSLEFSTQANVTQFVHGNRERC